MGTTRDTLGKADDGGVTLGIDRPRTYNDLNEHEKKRFDADIRATNIVLQGLPKDIYKLINQNTEAKAIWDNMSPGENITDYYVRFHKLVNDMKNIRMTMPNIQLNSKFVNNMTSKATLPQTNNQLRTSSNTRNQETMQDGSVVIQNVQERQNQWNFARGTSAAGNGNAHNRVGNENRAVLDEEELLFLADEQTNTYDADVDDQPVHDMAQNNPNIFQADDCDAFDSDIDDEPTAQTIFMENLSSAVSSLQQAVPSDASILSEHNEESVVPSGASFVQYDDYMMHENSAYVLDDSFTTTLNICKDQRITPMGITEGERGFEQTKRCYLTEPLESQNFQLQDTINKLQKENNYFQAENSKIKQNYKDLYDSIKIIRATHIEKITSLLNEIETLKTQVKGKIPVIPNENLIPTVSVCNKYAIDVEPIPPSQRNNKNVQQGHLNRLKDTLDTLCEIVEEARKNVIASCPNTVNKRDRYNASTHAKRNKHVTFIEPLKTSLNNTSTQVKQPNEPKINVPVIPSTEVNSVTKASRSPPRSNTKIHRTLTAKGGHKKNVKAHLRNNKSDLHKKNCVESSISFKRAVVNSNSNSHYKTCNKCMISFNHDECVAKFLKSSNKSLVKKIWRVKQVKQTWQPTWKVFTKIVLWYLDSGYSKHMTGDRSRLKNFVKIFIGTVRFENDHFRAIMGYRDYVIGDSVIPRVYYVEELGHNLFSVGTRGTNLYTIFVEDMMRSSPICLLSKASKNKSWLWHLRWNHLNFGTINDLARKDLVCGLPRLKFEKDHLCSACQLGKSKKYAHKPKTVNTIMEVLHTLHIDLCGPMRVQSINEKKYILITVNDYSRLIRTDNGTEFVNRHLIQYFESVGISHQKSVPRTPQQKVRILGKLQAKADIGFFVGYAPDRKGYQIYNK
nr:retrovirus-related Pol polyprotein from transposon TNT 1-94 [Tanacetum cinerariifolium]